MHPQMTYQEALDEYRRWARQGFRDDYRGFEYPQEDTADLDVARLDEAAKHGGLTMKDLLTQATPSLQPPQQQYQELQRMFSVPSSESSRLPSINPAPTPKYNLSKFKTPDGRSRMIPEASHANTAANPSPDDLRFQSALLLDEPTEPAKSTRILLSMDSKGNPTFRETPVPVRPAAKPVDFIPPASRDTYTKVYKDYQTEGSKVLPAAVDVAYTQMLGATHADPRLKQWVNNVRRDPKMITMKVRDIIKQRGLVDEDANQATELLILAGLEP